jgi:hypothetical protein
MPDRGTPTYPININLTVVDKTLSSLEFNIDKRRYYLLTVTYQNIGMSYTANMVVHELAVEDNFKRVLSLQRSKLDNNQSLDFTNKPVEIGDITKISNPMSLMAMGVYNKFMDMERCNTLASYFLQLLRKTSEKALEVYRTGLAMIACPLQDDLMCSECDGVNWANLTTLLQSTPECKKNYNDFCTKNPSHALCDCYAPENHNNPSCKAWRDLIQGLPSCTMADFEKFKNDNNLCPCKASDDFDASSMLAKRLSDAIIDFYKADAIYVDDENGNSLIETTEPSFFEWLFSRNQISDLNRD